MSTDNIKMNLTDEQKQYLENTEKAEEAVKSREARMATITDLLANTKERHYAEIEKPNGELLTIEYRKLTFKEKGLIDKRATSVSATGGRRKTKDSNLNVSVDSFLSQKLTILKSVTAPQLTEHQVDAMDPDLAVSIYEAITGEDEEIDKETKLKN